MRFIAAALLFLFATPALAQPFDIAILGQQTSCSIGTPISFEYLEFSGDAYDGDVSDLETIAAAGNGRVLALVRPGAAVVAIAPNLVRTPVFAGIPGTTGTALVADRAGNIYILGERSGESRLLGVTPQGALRFDIALPGADGPIDLAADQCTLFYWGAGGIQRFNVCEGNPLTSFVASLPPHTRDFKILPDGGVLVLTANSLVRYSSGGVLVSTRPLTPSREYSALALGENGASAYLDPSYDCNAVFQQVDITTGAVIREVPTNVLFSYAYGIVPYRGWTAAIGATAHAAEVPALSTLAITALSLMLAVAALRRLG